MSDAVLNLIDRVWCADSISSQATMRPWPNSWTANGSPSALGDNSSPESPPLLQLPGYEQVEWIGQGGMGRVYRAFDPELRRFVAIKTLLRFDAAHRERFRREAVAAAQLVHPHIVQIHDVGEHEQQPYLVLEFIFGRTLGQRLASRPQSPAVAAALVEQLARAMEFAHHKGVVHRDLKPDNILIVDSHPGAIASTLPPALLATDVPKITDFGLAKLDDSLDPVNLMTADERLVGTLQYAAPEQISRDLGPIGKGTDIHALGVILYEMLTGVRPFVAADLRATMTRIALEDPLAPDQLQPQVPRDLATICLQCLRKKAADRYASAQDLADDLRRFLEHRPVLARRISSGERLWKWAKREPWVAGLSGALVLLAVVSLVGAGILVRNILHHAERAETNASRAQAHAIAAMDAYNQIAFQIQDQLRHQPATQPLRRVLLDSAYQGLIRLEQSADVPGAQPQRSLAAIQLNRAEMAEMMGNLTDAADAYERARQAFAALAAQSPRDPQALFDLAAAHNRLGAISRKLRRFADATQHHERDLALTRQLLADTPTDSQLQRNLATSLVGAGDLALELGNNSVALDYYQEALGLDRQVAQASPTAAAQRNLAVSLGRVADLQAPTEASRLIEEALRIYQERVPGWLGRDGQATCHQRLGRLAMTSRNFPAARQELLTALQVRETLRDDDPTHALNLWQLVAIHQDLGAVEVEEQRFAEALEHFSTGKHLCERFVAQDARNPDAHYECGVCLEKSVAILQELDRDSEAQDRLAEARQHYQTTLQLDPQHAEAQKAIERVQRGPVRSGATNQQSDHQAVNQLQQLIVTAVRKEQYDQARELIEQARTRLSGIQDEALRLAAESNWNTLRTYVTEAERAMANPDTIPGESTPMRSMLLVHRACVLADRGDHAAAANLASQIQAAKPETPENHYNAATVYALCHRAVTKSTAPDPNLLAKYHDLAFRALIKAIARGFRDRAQLESDADWEHMRSDPAFQRTIQVLSQPLDNL